MSGVMMFRYGSFADTRGVLVYLGSDAAEAAGQTIDFDAEAYDYANYHSLVSATDKLTIPSGITRGRLISNAQTSSGSVQIQQLKNNASFRGRGVAMSATAGNDTGNSPSAIVAVSAGNELTVDTVPGATFVAGATWFAFEPIPTSRKGALVYKSSDQNLSAATTTTISFDSEDYDSDGFHDNSSNNSRLTVPSGLSAQAGVSLIRITGALDATSIGAQIVLSFLKNGGSARGLPAIDGTGSLINAASAVLAVSPGDYFELQAFTTNAGTIESGNDSWFQIEEIVAGQKYALVYRSTNQSIPDSAFTAIEWDSEVADTDSFHDAGSPTRLTVPSGCARARLTFNLRNPSSTTAQCICRVTKNGSPNIPGLPAYENNTAGTDSLNGMGAWVEVTPGDYFELEFYQDSGGSVSLADHDTLWFCIEAE